MKMTSPVFSIETDWEDNLRKVNGKAWVCCKFKGSASIRGKVCRTKGLDTWNVADLETTDGFDVKFFSPGTIHIGYKETPYSCIFITPYDEFRNIHAKSVTSLNTTSSALCASVSSECEDIVVIWDATKKEKKLRLEGHLADVYKCRWFPSGRVVLSCGADMQIKIWCAETGRCPVTLRGHKQGVTDIAIVDKGRNIISVSRDGSCKLWNCGQSSCLVDLIQLSSVINCCSISDTPDSLTISQHDITRDEREVGTENKILLVGCEDGTVTCISVCTRKKLFDLKANSAVNACCTVKPGLFAVGCQDGEVLLLNATKLEQPVQSSWSETNNPVLSMLSCYDGFFCGHADGTCFFRSHITAFAVSLQLSGPHTDPIYDISYDNKYVYTACRDGVIRRYYPEPHINKYFRVR